MSGTPAPVNLLQLRVLPSGMWISYSSLFFKILHDADLDPDLVYLCYLERIA